MKRNIFLVVVLLSAQLAMSQHFPQTITHDFGALSKEELMAQQLIRNVVHIKNENQQGIGWGLVTRFVENDEIYILTARHIFLNGAGFNFQKELIGKKVTFHFHEHSSITGFAELDNVKAKDNFFKNFIVAESSAMDYCILKLKIYYPIIDDTHVNLDSRDNCIFKKDKGRSVQWHFLTDLVSEEDLENGLPANGISAGGYYSTSDNLGSSSYCYHFISTSDPFPELLCYSDELNSHGEGLSGMPLASAKGMLCIITNGAGTSNNDTSKRTNGASSNLNAVSLAAILENVKEKARTEINPDEPDRKNNNRNKYAPDWENLSKIKDADIRIYSQGLCDIIIDQQQAYTARCHVWAHEYNPAICTDALAVTESGTSVGKQEIANADEARKRAEADKKAAEEKLRKECNLSEQMKSLAYPIEFQVTTYNIMSMEPQWTHVTTATELTDWFSNTLNDSLAGNGLGLLHFIGTADYAINSNGIAYSLAPLFRGLDTIPFKADIPYVHYFGPSPKADTLTLHGTMYQVLQNHELAVLRAYYLHKLLEKNCPGSFLSLKGLVHYAVETTTEKSDACRMVYVRAIRDCINVVDNE